MLATTIGLCGEGCCLVSISRVERDVANRLDELQTMSDKNFNFLNTSHVMAHMFKMSLNRLVN